MAGFWTALKNFFTGGGEDAAPAGPTTPERFCITCRKITAGEMTPKEAGGKKVLEFTCSECTQTTQVLA